MKDSAITLDNLAREIAGELDIPILKTKKILLLTLDEIAEELKDKDKVRLNGFGTLRKTTLKSRRIIQVQSGNSRLLLAQESIRFVPTPELRATLAGRAYVPDRGRVKKIAPSKSEGSENLPLAPKGTLRVISREQKVGKSESSKIEVKTVQNIKPVTKPKRTIELAPLPSFVGRVNPEIIRQKIRERLIKLARTEPKRVGNLKPIAGSLSSKIFLALIRNVLKDDLNSLNFSLDKQEKVNIFAGRPRKKIATLEKNVAADFLTEYFEIERTDLPQARFARINFGSKIKLVELHSLPIEGGMSILIKVK